MIMGTQRLAHNMLDSTNDTLLSLKVSIGISIGLCVADFIVYTPWWRILTLVGLCQGWLKEANSPKNKEKAKNKALFAF